MKVFKFGGASINSVERIKNVAAIVREYGSADMMIVVSAMGKTTNALEKVVEAFYQGNQQEALSLFNIVRQNHLNTAKFLLVKEYNRTLEELSTFFTEVEWMLHDKPVRDFDYYYDQVVCIGELLSGCIVSSYLTETGIQNQLLDVRDIIRTDDQFRDATVNFEYTANRLRDLTGEKLSGIYVAQGFIGSTDENESTTLGREGSDYTAAIFANLLNASELTIWKDVEGVMNADPKLFPDAILIPELSYSEIIEMAYYGAQVIHPKTIKPLQNKGINLVVKSFINPTNPGTVVSNRNVKNLPSIKVIKQQQVLISLRTHDFSFVGEKPMVFLYNLFAELHLKPNLIQTAAIGVQLCFDDHAEKIPELAAAAGEYFDVQLDKELSLLTVRHFDAGAAQTIHGRQILLQQQTTDTVQYLYR